MKNIFHKYFTLLLLFLSSLVVLPGCGDDKDFPDPAGSAPGSITATVNGAAWESSEGNYRVGTRAISNGASAFVGPADTLTIIGVSVQGTDTTAIVLSVKLSNEKIGSYPLRSGTAGRGNAYFLTNISGNALQETKERYDDGITNGELRITDYDPTYSRVSGNFGFSMSATGETTYTVIAGNIDNVTF